MVRQYNQDVKNIKGEKWQEKKLTSGQNEKAQYVIVN